jgi:lysophospholipase L1-like esterase
MRKIIFLFLLTLPFCLMAQSFRWFDPVSSSYPVIDGRAWHKELASAYDRFPAVAEKNVRQAVWNLSRNTAGEYIGFKTNSKVIVVKYVVKGNQSMYHMPATGVAGIDLYAKDVNGDWRWAKGGYKFGDTITYRFENMVLSQPIETFRLYLPMYTAVQWIKIGVPEGNSLELLPVSEEKPIVAYGPSIRKLNARMINLGFSGNGQLEQPVIDLINSIDAKMYILDCMPNLTLREQFPAAEIEKRIRKSVADLQSKHPGVPIVLAEHCSGLEGMNMDSVMTSRYKAASEIAAEIFQKMKKEGIRNIYLLTASAIGFTTESTVDGTHPNDIGMMQYAEAYEKLIRKIK